MKEKRLFFWLMPAVMLAGSISWTGCGNSSSGDPTSPPLGVGIGVTPTSYTVTWKNYDGTVLETDTGVPAGTTPSYDGATPTKAADGEYTYAFSGWNPAVAVVSGNAEYTAVFTSIPAGLTFTITWKNYDGTVLETDTDVEPGTIPSYNGADPIRAADVQYTYAFSGWSPAIAAVSGNAEYTAQFTQTLRSYTITWKDGDTILRTDTVASGGTASGPTPTHGGKSFAGWEDDTGTVFTPGMAVTVTRDMTLYARWTDNPVVTFEKNAPDASDPVPLSTAVSAPGASLGSLPTPPSRTGYDFAGWNTAAGGTGSAFNGATAVNGSLTVYARWTVITYTITYNLAGGTGTPASGTYTIESPGITLPSPTRAGYSFIGWYDTARGDLVTGISPGSTGDRSFMAQWSDKEVYTITYHDGTSTTTGNYTIDGITLPVLTKTGWTFDGWYTAASGGTRVSTIAAGHIGAQEFWAQWTPITYTVSYNGNSATGGSAPSSQTKTYGTNLVLQSNTGSLSRTGYTFAGWNTSSTGDGAGYGAGATLSTDLRTTNGTVTLYAQWMPVTYTVSYNANAATGGSAPSSQTKTYGRDLALQSNTGSLSRTGYTFAGWNTSSTGDGAGYGAGATLSTDLLTENGTVTLYARWMPLTYTISYHPNLAGGGSVPSNQTKTYGTNLVLQNNTGSLVRTGYTFVGWNTSSTGNGTGYGAGATLSTDLLTENGTVTLYAQWTPITYTVAYDPNSATSGSVPLSQTKTYGRDLALQTNTGSLARTGYTFVGWNTSSTGNGTGYGAGATLSTDLRTESGTVTLYAQWHLDSGIQVEFDGTPTHETKEWEDEAVAPISISWTASVNGTSGGSLTVLVNTATGEWANGASFAWYLDGVPIAGTSERKILYAKDYALGTHQLAVKVTKGGGGVNAVSYSKTVIFTVEK